MTCRHAKGLLQRNSLTDCGEDGRDDCRRYRQRLAFLFRLNETLFFTISQARSILARWVADYNTKRPHGDFRIYILLRREGWFVNRKRVYPWLTYAFLKARVRSIGTVWKRLLLSTATLRLPRNRWSVHMAPTDG